jgi:predicted Zn-dependent protease
MNLAFWHAAPKWALGLHRWQAAVVVCALLVAAFFGARSYHNRAERREAFRLREREGFVAAEPVLLKLYEHDQRDVDVVRLLAVGYMDARNLLGTEKFLNRWCELDPRDPEPFRRRIEFWNMQQKVPEGIADARHILKLEPRDFRMRRLLVELLTLDGRFQEAEEEGLRCFKANPKDVDLWCVLANVYYGLEQKNKAADLVDQVLHEKPDHVNGLKLRSKLYLEAGKPDSAITLLRRLVDSPVSNPNSTDGMYELSMALTRAGQTDKAKRVLAEMDYRVARRLWSEYEHRDQNVGLQERFVDAMLALGKTDEAVRFLSDILKRNPAAPTGTRQLLARCSERQADERKRGLREGEVGRPGDKERRRQGDSGGRGEQSR